MIGLIILLLAASGIALALCLTFENPIFDDTRDLTAIPLSCRLWAALTVPAVLVAMAIVWFVSSIDGEESIREDCFEALRLFLRRILHGTDEDPLEDLSE